MAGDVHVSDTGTVFRLRLVDEAGSPIDLSASQVRFRFLSPRKRTFTVQASCTGDGTDGRVEYVIAPGDLDVPGRRWQVQALVQGPEGQWSSEVFTFVVAASLSSS